MLSELKKSLLKNQDNIVELLKRFGYCNIVKRSKYIQCGRDEEGSVKSIVIRTEDNDYLYVKDYPRNIYCDLISYIMKQRNVEFLDVLNTIKNILHITDYYDYFSSKSVFGGFYDSIKKKTSCNIKTYDNSILNNYKKIGNLRFLKDNISLEAQKYFGIGYDVDSQGIIIPIYDPLGQLVGIKIRVNRDTDDGEQKYYYIVPCLMSQTLYGYSHNYNYIVENTVYIFESEKSVLQCYSYGIKNCVAMGSSSFSKKQAQVLLELKPKRIIFLQDEGSDFECIKRNIEMIQSCSRMMDVEIGYWDYEQDIDIPLKSSPSDLGKRKLLEIIDTQIIMTGDEKYKEKLRCTK